MPFLIVQGDVEPPLRATLRSGPQSIPVEERPVVPLTGALRVDFYMSAASAGSPLLVMRQAVIEDVAGGKVRHDWLSADTATLPPGLYLGQFRIVWPSGPQTHPNDEPIEIVVTPFVG